MEKNYIQTIKHIKEEILKSRYAVAKVANKEMLFLYYKVGHIISIKVASEKWGSKTINKFSEDLQYEMDGLRGFSADNLKKMKRFYEEWEPCFNNILAEDSISSSLTNQFENVENLIGSSLTIQFGNNENEIGTTASEKFENAGNLIGPSVADQFV